MLLGSFAWGCVSFALLEFSGDELSWPEKDLDQTEDRYAGTESKWPANVGYHVDPWHARRDSDLHRRSSVAKLTVVEME